MSNTVTWIDKDRYATFPTRQHRMSPTEIRVVFVPQFLLLMIPQILLVDLPIHGHNITFENKLT